MSASAIRVDFVMPRGDTWGWDGVVVFTAEGAIEYPLGLATDGAVLRSTIKLRVASEDPSVGDLAAAALGNAQVDSTMDVQDGDGGISVLSATEFYVEFPPAITELMPLGELYYDVVIDFSITQSFTLMTGRIRNLADVTLTRS